MVRNATQRIATDIKAKTDMIGASVALESGGNVASIKAKTDVVGASVALESGGNISNILSQVDIKNSTMQNTILQALTSAVGNITLEQKAAMDEATYSDVQKSGNNYILQNLLDCTTFTEVDPASKITLSTSRITVTNEIDSVSRTYKTVSGYTGFTFYFDFNISTMTSQSEAFLLLLGDEIEAWDFAGMNAVGVYIFDAGSNNWAIAPAKVVLGTKTTGSFPFTYQPGSATIYYVTLIRSGTNLTLNIYSDTGRTTLLGTSTLAGVAATSFSRLHIANNNAAYNKARSYYVENIQLSSITTGTIKSNAITKDPNVGLRYWGYIKANFGAGAGGSTVKMKICDSAGTPLHSNFVTIAASEYARIPLMRPVILTATGDSQTMWNFTSLSNADAFINELGVLAKAILVELALDGTNYSVLAEVTNFNEDISNILAPKITLISGTGVVNATSKLRVTYIVNVPLANTTIKLQLQLNRTVIGDTSPSIQPLVGDATKYISAGQVALI